MDTLEWMEASFGWAGGLGAIVTLVALIYGSSQGLPRRTTRSYRWSGSWFPAQAPFYVFASIAYFVLCYLMWQPLPLSLAPQTRATNCLPVISPLDETAT